MNYQPFSMLNNNGQNFSTPSFNNNNRGINLSTDKIKPSNKFKIVTVLDESGSMSSMRQEMIDALNSLISEQKEVKERPALFTLVKFNDRITRVIKNMDLQDINPLTIADYTPSATTALYDALGDTINWFENERDVLMIIITDGMENASREYNQETVKKMLEEKQKNNNWSYVYLSDDLSTKKQADNISLMTSNFCTNKNVRRGGHASYLRNNLNSAIRNYRQTGMSVQSQLNSE